MWKHNNFINLQLYAPPVGITVWLTVNGFEYKLAADEFDRTWVGKASVNSEYTISGNTIVWENGGILQHNGVNVLPTANMDEYDSYTTDGGSQGETWIWNDTVEESSISFMGSVIDIPFRSNNTAYSELSASATTSGIVRIHYSSSTGGVDVYSNAWANEEYRTIIFAMPVTDSDLLATLQANATKQSASTLTFKHFFDAGLQGTGTYKFRHYSQQEPSSGETWVLNETLTLTPNTFSVDFTANNSNYTEIWMSDRELAYGDSSNVVYATKGGWIIEANKTLVFATAPTGDLLTWLQANGTKQGGGQ